MDDCKEIDLDNPYVKCSDILNVKMKKNILFNTEEQLKIFSQHKLVDNAFFNVNIGGWKYGIWGLCPSEILHRFYEGMLCLQPPIVTWVNSPVWLVGLSYTFEGFMNSNRRKRNTSFDVCILL